MEKNNNILSIDSDDDNENYVGFTNFLVDNTNRVKDSDADMITAMGVVLIRELEEKKRVKSKEIEPLIEYILKHSNKYTSEYLHELDHNDVKDIHSEVKYENRGFFAKLIEFFS